MGNYKKFIGIDEVGRGAFAGPLVAAAVVFPPIGFSVSSRLRGQKHENLNWLQKYSETEIRDSKTMTAKQREVADEWIRSNFEFSVGVVRVNEINAKGITWANQIAFERALEVFEQNNFLYSDAFEVKSWPLDSQIAIKQGDRKNKLISAASIVAKVYRDSYMKVISRDFEQYGWDTNKGYGTKSHRESIIGHGQCIHHRKQFVNTFLSKI